MGKDSPDVIQRKLYSTGKTTSKQSEKHTNISAITSTEEKANSNSTASWRYCRRARAKVLVAEPPEVSSMGRGTLKCHLHKTLGFLNSWPTVCGKNGLLKRSTHVNQTLDDPSYIPQGTHKLLVKIIPASIEDRSPY